MTTTPNIVPDLSETLQKVPSSVEIIKVKVQEAPSTAEKTVVAVTPSNTEELNVENGAVDDAEEIKTQEEESANQDNKSDECSKDSTSSLPEPETGTEVAGAFDQESSSEPTVSTDNGESSNASDAKTPKINCVFCNVSLTRTDRPMLLECLHSACAACIDAKLQEQPDQEQDILDSNAVLCPLCSITSDRTNLIIDRFILEAYPGTQNVSEEETTEANICVSCDDNIQASSFCEDCSELLCDACVQAHRRVRVTKDHSIVEKSQAKQGQRRNSTNQDSIELRCTTHPAESLSLFCEKCDRLTCRDCQLTEHREHKFKFVNEIATEARQSLHSLLNEVTYKRGLLESAVKVIDKRQSAIQDKKQQVVQDITRLVVLLTNAINSRGKQLVQRLGEVCDNKQKTLVEKRSTLLQITKLTDHCINSVKTQLDCGSDLALLWSKKTIMRHLQRIKSRRADIPNPDIPVRIHFAQQRVDTLCNALANVGGIVVDGRAYPASESADGRSSKSPGLQTMVPAAAVSPSPTNLAPGPPPAQQHTPHHQRSVLVSYPAQSHQGVNVRPPGNSHQVTSSTHPSAQQQQLRTLLAPNIPAPPPYMSARGVANHLPNLRPLNMPPPTHHQQQFQNQALMRPQGLRMPMHRPPPPLTPATPLQQVTVGPRAPVWHIPPDRPVHMSQAVPQQATPVNDNFRITISNQWLPNSEQVTSSGIQRSTPSPAATGHCKTASEAETHMDNFCQKSMDELFSTIETINPTVIKHNAVAPEASISSMVDSSTGSPASQRSGIAGITTQESPTKDDPNDDWCAVCMDGGNLICCDRCPKVFHTHCHIPQLASIDEEAPGSWQCLLCTPISEILNTPLNLLEEGAQKMNARHLRIAQRLLLELYCQYDHSQPFREPVNPELVPGYADVVQHPMSLSIIKKRLELGHSETYTDIKNFIQDVRLIFQNAYAFNPPGSPVHGDAQALETIFDKMVSKWMPTYQKVAAQKHYSTEDESEDGPSKKKKSKFE